MPEEEKTVNLPDPATAIDVDDVREMLAAMKDGRRDAYGRSLALGVADRCVRTFVEGIMRRGGLARIEGCDAHRSRFLLAWNALADATWDDADRRNAKAVHLGVVAYTVSHAILMPGLVEAEMQEKKGDPVDVEALLARLRKALVEGKDERWKQRPDADYCDTSGMRLEIDLAGWRPAMGRMDHAAGRIVPTGYSRPEPIDHVTVTFRGGPVLVGDWIRIPEFTAITRGLTDEFDLNSEAGAREYVRRYAELGFVSVHVGNTCPSVMMVGDDVVVGSVDMDAGIGATCLGTVCTDLWRATMIERERLVEIIADVHGREEAERKVEAFLEGSDRAGAIETIEIPVGEYHVYFSGHHDMFLESFASDDLDVPDGVEPFFVMSRRELRLTDGPEAPSGPRF